MAWYEYRPAAKPLYRQPTSEAGATIKDALFVYGALILAAVLMLGILVALLVFAGWKTLWFVLAVGAAYFILDSRR